MATMVRFRSGVAAVAGAVALCASRASLAGARVWDSRDLWATPPGGSASDAGGRLDAAFSQFADWPAYVEIAIAAALAIGLSWFLAFTGRTLGERVGSLEERKGLVLIGFGCAVIGALTVVQPMVAVLIVGLGLLLRMPSLVSAPTLRSRAVIIAAVGFAIGFSQYLLAVAVTAAAWGALRWLGGHRFASVKVRIGPATDRERAKKLLSETLARMNCRIQAVREGRSGRSFVFTVRVPASVADEFLSRGLAASVHADLGPVEVEVRDE